MPRGTSLQAALPGIWQLCRRLRPEIARERRLLGWSTAALLAELALRVLEPWPLKLVFDFVLMPLGTRPQSESWLRALEPGTLVPIAAVALFAFIGLRAYAAYLHTIGFALAANRVLTQVRAALYRHLQVLSLGYHARARAGDLVVRVISDVGLLQDVLVTALIPLLTNTCTLLAMLALMFWLNWQLALLATTVIPVMWLSGVVLTGRIGEASRQQRRREGAMAAAAAESIGSIKAVQALSLESAFGAAFSRQNSQSLKDGVRAKRLSTQLERSVDLLIACATALVIWRGGALALAGHMSPGDLLVFLAYLKSGFKPAQDLAKFTARIAKASAAAERVFDVLDRTPEVRDAPGARPAPPLRGAVSFSHVSFAYEEHGRRALDDVSFEVPAGTRVAIVGPSGAGKSTLASLLLRLYDPQAGVVSVDGVDVRCYTLDSLRAQTSVVLQETLLFAATIRENIAHGAANATDAEVEEAAKLANAHAFITRMPEGYDTLVGERGVTMSAGQRQRLAIARAAVRRAPLLVVDEPATGLDRESERALSEGLDRLADGRTVLLITHDLERAAGADLILYFEDGRIAEGGTHADLMRQAGRYATLFSLQRIVVPPPATSSPGHVVTV